MGRIVDGVVRYIHAYTRHIFNKHYKASSNNIVVFQYHVTIGRFSSSTISTWVAGYYEEIESCMNDSCALTSPLPNTHNVP